jgi:hypothetical protein
VLRAGSGGCVGLVWGGRSGRGSEPQLPEGRDLELEDMRATGRLSLVVRGCSTTGQKAVGPVIGPTTSATAAAPGTGRRLRGGCKMD